MPKVLQLLGAEPSPDFTPHSVKNEMASELKPFNLFWGDKAVLDAVTTDAHHLQDYPRAVRDFLKSIFVCWLEFAPRAGARGGVLSAVLLTSLLSYAWKRKDTRET